MQLLLLACCDGKIPNQFKPGGLLHCSRLITNLHALSTVYSHQASVLRTKARTVCI